MLNNYKSWSGLRKKLEDDLLCNSLKGRIQYFLTAYHDVYNSYRRASIKIDGKDVVNFTWIKGYQMDYDINNYLRDNKLYYDRSLKIEEKFKDKWDENCLYGDYDFLDAIQQFLSLSIFDAINSQNYIIRVLAVLDRRIGKRTLKNIKDTKEIEHFPEWVRQFYKLRFDAELIL